MATRAGAAAVLLLRLQLLAPAAYAQPLPDVPAVVELPPDSASARVEQLRLGDEDDGRGAATSPWRSLAIRDSVPMRDMRAPSASVPVSFDCCDVVSQPQSAALTARNMATSVNRLSRVVGETWNDHTSGEKNRDQKASTKNWPRGHAGGAHTGPQAQGSRLYSHSRHAVFGSTP